MVDIRSMKSIIEWKAQPPCNAQFSFDENSIYAVDDSGEVSFLLHLSSYPNTVDSYPNGPFINLEHVSLVVH